MEPARNEAFPMLEQFKPDNFTLFGTDEQPVPLGELLESELQQKAITARINTLTRQYVVSWLLSIGRVIPSVVGVAGIVIFLAWLPLLCGVKPGEWMAWSGIATLISVVVRGAWRDDFGHGYFLTRYAQSYLSCERYDREEKTAEKKKLQAQLAMWNRIPAAIQADVRQLVEHIASYNANVRLHNAEAKRAAFYVHRGHYKHEELEAGLAAMREMIAVQEREIEETIATIDKACIALVLQPEGEGAAIIPDLEAIRERLAGLGNKVGEHLALERIIRTELPSSDEDLDRRLLAARSSSAATK